MSDIRCSYVVILASSLRRRSRRSFFCATEYVLPSDVTWRCSNILRFGVNWIYLEHQIDGWLTVISQLRGPLLGRKLRQKGFLAELRFPTISSVFPPALVLNCMSDLYHNRNKGISLRFSDATWYIFRWSPRCSMATRSCSVHSWTNDTSRHSVNCSNAGFVLETPSFTRVHFPHSESANSNINEC